MKKAVAIAALGLASVGLSSANAGTLRGSGADPVAVAKSAYGFSANDLKADHLGRVSVRGELPMAIEFTRMAGDSNCCNSNCKSGC